MSSEGVRVSQARWERRVHLMAQSLGLGVLAVGLIYGVPTQLALGMVGALALYNVSAWLEELFLRSPEQPSVSSEEPKNNG